MKRFPPPLVVVTWRDASYQHGDLTADEMTPLVDLVNVGWLVRDDKDSVSLAMQCCEADDNYRHICHIPKVNILQMRRVKPWKRTRS